MAWNSFCSVQGEECACFTLWKVISVLQGCCSQMALCLPALFCFCFFSVCALVPKRIWFPLLSLPQTCSLSSLSRHLNTVFVQNKIITVRITNYAPFVLHTAGFSLKTYLRKAFFYPSISHRTLKMALFELMKFKMTRPTFELSHFTVGCTLAQGLDIHWVV